MSKKGRKETSAQEEAGQAMMESDLVGCLLTHLMEKGEEMKAALQHLESVNPTLNGYALGFKRGYDLACEAVSAASESVGVGREFVDRRFQDVYPEFCEKYLKVKR